MMSQRILGLIVPLIVVAGCATSQRSIDRTVAPDDTALSERMVADVQFDQTPLREALETLLHGQNFNVYVHWRAMEQAGIDDSVPVTVSLRNVPLDTALDLVLEDASGGVVYLVHWVEDGVVHISTAEDRNRTTEWRVYDVARIIGSGADRDERAQTLAQALTDCLGHMAWDGPRVIVVPWEGRFLVEASPDVHEGVADLLRQLNP